MSPAENPAVNYREVISSMIGDEGQRDVEASQLSIPEVLDTFFSPDEQPNALEDAVGTDNRAMRRRDFKVRTTSIASVSIGGVNHMIYQEQGVVYAVPAFSNPVYLGRNIDEVRHRLYELRRATQSRRSYDA